MSSPTCPTRHQPCWPLTGVTSYTLSFSEVGELRLGGQCLDTWGGGEGDSVRLFSCQAAFSELPGVGGTGAQRHRRTRHVGGMGGRRKSLRNLWVLGPNDVALPARHLYSPMIVRWRFSCRRSNGPHALIAEWFPTVSNSRGMRK